MKKMELYPFKILFNIICGTDQLSIRAAKSNLHMSQPLTTLKLVGVYS